MAPPPGQADDDGSSAAAAAHHAAGAGPSARSSTAGGPALAAAAAMRRVASQASGSTTGGRLAAGVSAATEARIEALETKLAGVHNLGGKLLAVEQMAQELGLDIPDIEVRCAPLLASVFVMT